MASSTRIMFASISRMQLNCMHFTPRAAASFATRGFRTHTCVEASKIASGSSVTLSGWVQSCRKHGGVLFVALRDHTGLLQLTIEHSTHPDVFAAAAHLKPESVVQATGQIRGKHASPGSADGVELFVDTLQLLNSCETLPIQLFTAGRKEAEKHDVTSGGLGEDLRLKHRHLDLRRSVMQRNIRLRSSVVHAARCFLHDHRFTEIETPTLFLSTPEGAREFLVPTRARNRFYALTQSPQQYKQIARCYRDEGGRADRQPEFTQIDMELAFATVDAVKNVVEGMVKQMLQAARAFASSCEEREYPPLPQLCGTAESYPELSFAYVMSRYGSDKPDRRVGMPLVDVSDLFAAPEACTFPHFQTAIADWRGTVCNIPPAHSDLSVFDGSSVRAVRVPNGAALTRKQQEEVLTQIALRVTGEAKSSRAPVALCKVTSNGHSFELSASPLAKALDSTCVQRVCERLGANSGDMIAFSCGSGFHPCEALGVARLELAAVLQHAGIEGITACADDGEPPIMQDFDAFWVTGFPLFERTVDDLTGQPIIKSSHHPFTAPVQADEHLLRTNDEANWLLVRGQHYDFVANGMELGGGSIRIHEADMQHFVLQTVLQLSPERVHSFNHLITALRQGAPPHGGIALGLDRFISVLAGAASVRDVIAFPKSMFGNELMTGAPSGVTKEQLDVYHIQLAPEPQDSTSL